MVLLDNLFFQEDPYWASDDVNILTPKFVINRYIALFLTSVIRHVGQNYAFIDKWVLDAMKSTTVLLPSDKLGNPDWAFMENFIKSLPYSKYI